MDEKKRLSYDKAIEGYQFQVGRYNTWMNYYSIFVGALFVALYNIWPSATDGCCCCKCGGTVSGFDVWFLPIVISVLGFFASICWYGALLGYRKWNGHWIGVIQKIEKCVFPNSYEAKEAVAAEDLKVYGDMPKKPEEKPEYVVGYISTQKITGIFIVFIMLAWIAAFSFAIYKYNNDCCSACVWAFGVGVIIMIVLLCCLHCGHCCLFSSKIIKKE